MSPIIWAVTIGLALFFGIGSRRYLKTDNIIEETAEKIIFDKTGYDIDLSPDTPEGDTPDK